MEFNPQPDPHTTAWRIYHDAAKGIWVDHFDGHWWVQTNQNQFPEFLISAAKAQGVKSVHWRPREANAQTSASHQWGESVTSPLTVIENGACFKIDFSAGYSPGIFLDQRVNRKQVLERSKRGQKVLNAFAYTGAFSVMAALGGAETSTLDLSKTYLDWTWENFDLNQLDPQHHHGCKGDAFEWLATFGRQERRFDGVILDPPTFSRNKKKTFRTDRDYAQLACLGAAITRPGGWLLCCANTHRLSLRDYQNQVEQGIRAADRRVSNIKKKLMPAEFNHDDYLKSLWVVVG